MSTVDERNVLEEALEAIRGSQAWDIPTGGYLNSYQCPLCDTPLLEDLTFDEMEKIKTFTVAQLISWHEMQQRSGVDPHELLARTSSGQGEYVSVEDFRGMYVGIEKDGYTHT